MSLEDFFTLMEIKDGLTAASRVEELVSVMQKDKDYIVKNVSDATRQWAAVASTIAATKNKDCLDVFVQLDGLRCIDGWLRHALLLSNDSTDSSIEESIIALLRALESLNVDSQRSISSGIWPTVNNLITHGSSRVQDIARALFDSWKQDKDNYHLHHDADHILGLHDHAIKVNTGIIGESTKPEIASTDVPLSKQSGYEEIHEAEVGEAESLPSANSDESKSEKGKDLEPQASNKGFQSTMILDLPETDGRPKASVPHSYLANAIQENSSLKEKCSMGDAGVAETGSSLQPKQGRVDAPIFDQCSGDAKQVDRGGSSADLSGVSGALASSSVGPEAMSSGTVVANDEEIKTEPVLQKSVDSSDASRPSDEPKSGIEDVGVTNNCCKQAVTLTRQDNRYDSDTSPDSSGESHRHKKPESTGASFHTDMGTSKSEKDFSKSKRSVGQGNGSYFSRSLTANRAFNKIDMRTTDIELECGVLDALEVATKVAQEVAREVVDSRESSCSSSEKLSNGNSQPGSPDSINGKQDLYTESPTKDVPDDENHSAEASLEVLDDLAKSHNLDKKPENGITDMESSLVTETAQQPETSAEKVPCSFDLNQDVCSGDTDHAVSSICTPIPVVSVSCPAAAPGLSATPLQFEGTLGWKGSAATSAFRPTSPRRISGVSTDNHSKQKPSLLGIDLNVAEGIDDKVEDVISAKQTPISLNLISADSSLEVNCGKSERFKLDLNCTNDDGDAPMPSDLRMEKRLFFNRNGHQSASPASSSSSMWPSVRNIDLNDGPRFHIDSSDQGPYHRQMSWNTNNCVGHYKADEPVISILGTKVRVNRKDSLPPASSFLPNGKFLEPTLDLNMARTGKAMGLAPSVPYTHSPIYSYNGLTTAPGLSFSAPMYIPGSSIPYMMDSRGVPVMPQVIGSAPVQPTYPQAPFIMNMVGGPTGLNGSGPLRPNFDLNSGFGFKGRNSDPTSLRQFFTTDHVRPVEEHSRGSSQASSSLVVGGKRKEPESGWEPYPLNSRPQRQPPWR